MSLSPLYLGVDPSELVALHLLAIHDETPGHIAIYNDDYFLLYFHIVTCRDLQLMK